MQVQRHCGDVGHYRHRPVEEEEPSGGVGALLAHELTRVGHEGTRGWATNGHFTEGSYHEEGENAADGVADCQSGAALGKASAGP